MIKRPNLFLPQLILSLALLPGALLTWAPAALAAGEDTKANELREQAVFDDYLNLRFDAAEAKLNEAIQLCESGCSKGVKAKLYRDLGVVYIAGMKQRDAGIGMFVEAVTLDAGIQLDPDLSSAELQDAMDEARELAGSAPPPESGGGAKQPPPKSNDLLPVSEYEGVFHTPVEEQLVNTPIPIYVEVRDEDWTAKVKLVKLFYRGFGMVRFKEVELPKVGEGYGMEISCKEVGMSPGKLDYYLVIIDEDGDAAADVGTESSSHSVALQTEIDFSPQPLPGREIPAQCEMPVVAAASASSGSAVAFEDCPPDFPGCEPEFEDDFDEPPDDKFPRHWITVGGQVDFLLMHAVGDACAGSATSELACFEGATYWDPTVKGGRQDVDGDGIFDDSGSTTGGFALGTKRVLVGYDYAITQNILAGARVGWAFGARPKLVYADLNTPSSDPLPPLHFEVRGAYWFGSEVLTDQFVRPFVQLSGGFAQVDAYLETEVVDQTNGRLCDAGNPATSACRVSVEAWRKTGTFFVSGGAGLTLAVTESVGILLEGRFMQLLPTSGSAVAGGGGLVFGF